MGQSTRAKKGGARDAVSKVAQQRLSVLELAREPGNVAEACRQHGMDRTPSVRRRSGHMKLAGSTSIEIINLFLAANWRQLVNRGIIAFARQESGILPGERPGRLAFWGQIQEQSQSADGPNNLKTDAVAGSVRGRVPGMPRDRSRSSPGSLASTVTDRRSRRSNRWFRPGRSR